MYAKRPNSKKKIAQVTMIDANPNEMRRLSRMLSGLDTEYNFLVTNKNIEFIDLNDVIKALQSLADEKK